MQCFWMHGVNLHFVNVHLLFQRQNHTNNHYINRQRWQVIHGLQTNMYINKYEYTSKPV